MRTSVWFKILTVMTMKSTVFWFVMPCSLERNWLIGWKHDPHFQGWRENHTRTQQKQAANLAYSSMQKMDPVRSPPKLWVLLAALLLVSWLASFLTLKMEAMCSTDISGFLKTAWHYNSEDCTLQNTHCFGAIIQYVWSVYYRWMK
jgi:hypothetical protein